MKLELIVATVAFTICSCNVSREGYTTTNGSPGNSELAVAPYYTPAYIDQNTAPESTVFLPIHEAEKLITDDYEATGTEPATPVINEGILIASAEDATGDAGAKSIAITTVMAKELRAAATTVESRFAQRVINRTANRMEKMNFQSQQGGRIKVMDKVKAKISQKFYAAYAPAGGAANILAIVSLITGILAFAWYTAFGFGVAAIVTGAIALAKGTDRRGMAIAGIVLGAIAIAFWSGWFVMG